MKSFILLLVCFLCVPFFSQAQNVNQNNSQYPSGISYQGKLMHNGQLYEGNESIVFELIDANDNVKWSETQQVLIERGLYSVVLGSVVPIADNIFSENSSLRLRIKIGNNPSMVVSSLNTVPYAYMAKSVAPNSVTSSSIESGGNDKILTTDQRGEVVWLNKSDFQPNAINLGSAGGDVTGNFNNLQINVGAITKDELATDAVETDRIKNEAVTIAKIKKGTANTIMVTNSDGDVAWEQPTQFATTLGSAGGDVTGNFDNLEIKPNIIETTNMKTDITNSDKVLATDGGGIVVWENKTNFISATTAATGTEITGTYPALSIGAVDPTKITTSGANKILSTNGSGNVTWENKTNFISATTAVTGTEITGTYPALSIGAVDPTKITTTGTDLVMVTDGTGTVKWENRNTFTSGSLDPATGTEITGTYPALSIGAVDPTKITTTGTDLVMVTDGTGTVKWENRNTFTSGSLDPATGTEITGTYPALSIGAVDPTKITTSGANKILSTNGSGNVTWENKTNFISATTAVTGTEITGTYPALSIGAVDPTKITTTGTDLVMVTDGTGTVKWENRNTFTSGSLDPATGTEITGTYPALSIGAVDPTKITTSGANKILSTNGSGNVTWENKTNFISATTAATGTEITGTYPALSIGTVDPTKITTTGTDLVMVTDGGGNVTWEDRINFATTLGATTGSEITGTYPALSIGAVDPTKITTSGANKILSTNGSGNVTWENKTNFISATTAATGTEITGTYPALSIGTVDPTKITTTGTDLVMVTDGGGNVTWEDRINFATTLGATTGSEITGTYPALSIGAVDPTKITTSGANKILSTNGSGNVTWENKTNFISATTAATGTEITGTYPALSIGTVDPTKITTSGANKILSTNGSGVVEWQNKANSIGTSDIISQSITPDKIKHPAIDPLDNTRKQVLLFLPQNLSPTIPPVIPVTTMAWVSTKNLIGTVELMDNAVTSSKILNGTILPEDLNNPGGNKVLTTNGGVLGWEDKSAFGASLPSNVGNLNVSGDMMVDGDTDFIGNGNKVTFGTSALGNSHKVIIYSKFDYEGDHFHIKGNTLESHFEGDVKIDGTLRVNGTTYSSDERYKKDIKTMNNSLNNIMSLRGTTYYWKDTVAMNSNFQFGVIAQEVEKVFPNLVLTDKEGFKSVNYIGLIPVLLQATKEQQEIIEQKETKIQNLELRLTELENKLAVSENLNVSNASAKVSANEAKKESDTEKRLQELERMLKMLTTKEVKNSVEAE